MNKDKPVRSKGTISGDTKTALPLNISQAQVIHDCADFFTTREERRVGSRYRNILTSRHRFIK